MSERTILHLLTNVGITDSTSMCTITRFTSVKSDSTTVYRNQNI